MKKAIIVICIIVGLLELFVIIAYFRIFNGAISSANQDWDTFIQIFNGFVMAVLTAVNIYIFYQLTVAIEDKNQERVIKSKLFEAQSIVTQMRIKQYEKLRDAINETTPTLYRGEYPPSNIDNIKKMLMAMDVSFLFKCSGNTEKDSFMTPLCNTICDTIETIENSINNCEPTKTTDLDALGNILTNTLIFIEYFIVVSIVQSAEIEDYINKHLDDVDPIFTQIGAFGDMIDNAVKKQK